MNMGFIQLHRKLIDWKWYKDSKMVHLFIHLLLLANHKEGEWQKILIKRGQLVSGLNSLSENTGISIQSLRTYLKRLELTGEITNHSTNKYRLITIIKYGEYQSDGKKSTNKSTSNSTNNQQSTNNQLTANNNDNNLNKKEKEIRPSLSDLKKEISEDITEDESNHLDSEIFEMAAIKHLFGCFGRTISPLHFISGKVNIATTTSTIIKSKIKEFSPVKLAMAVKGFSEDKWNMERNSHMGANWFFKDSNRLEQYISFFYKNRNGTTRSESEIEDFISNFLECVNYIKEK